jgi:threonine dehydrogenase-like Zn-dependent dehydrogenase
MKNETQTQLPDSMLAVRLHGSGFQNIKVDRIPVPRPNDNQLLVRVDAAGVCTSILKLVAQGDAHTFINGWDLAKFPVILGDEGSVTVVATGKNLAGKYSIGQRCAVQPAVDHAPINNRERYSNNGEGMLKVAVGYSLPGHLAEYMLIPEEVLAAECLLPLPSDDIPFFAGALCEPFSCVISAQDRHVRLHQASPTSPRMPKIGLLENGVTMVIGAGAMGRMHAEAALRFKPKYLLVVDVLDERLKWIRDVLAPRASATGTTVHAVLSAQSVSLLREVSGGRGADDIIVAVGRREIQVAAQQWLAQDGVLNLFGGLKRGEHVIELDTLRVHYDGIKLVGSSGGSPADMAQALRMVADRKFDPGQHLAMVGSLDQFPKALKMVEETKTDGKIVLYPQIQTTELIAVHNWGRAEEQEFLKKYGSSEAYG